MKCFYLIVNTRKEYTTEKAIYIKQYLEERGCTCYYRDDNAVFLPAGYKYTDPDAVSKQVECAITLGGDGTLIQAARELASKDIPLVGINMGHLGYLTQVGKDEEITTLLDCLISDNYHIESRMMLEGIAFHQGERFFENRALNDIVITRKGLLKVLKFCIYVNDQFLNSYKADGMIIASPTGSTAYNLSAGGPIVAPNAQMLVLTPICPHTMNTRSVVLSAEDRVKIEIEGYEGQEQAAVFDGDTMIDLQIGDYIQIERSKIRTRLVMIKNISFLDNLRNKMTGI